MVNKYVAELAAKVLSRKDNYVPITKTEKFKNTMKGYFFNGEKFGGYEYY